MNKTDASLRRYLREVKSWLPCGGNLKRTILDKIRGTVMDYLTENPQGDYAALVARFGTPQQIASAYVDETDTPELLRSLRIKRRVVTIIGAAAIVVVVLWAGVVTLSFVYNVNATNGYFVELVVGTEVRLD